ncbi:hypothetical protein DFJ73DRAFT_132311 [Zopfochytrium polystomum]|nr:hypothetical protein DFJ73DRAFT_132311 [Zopfochytrium polystomum]
MDGGSPSTVDNGAVAAAAAAAGCRQPYSLACFGAIAGPNFSGIVIFLYVALFVIALFGGFILVARFERIRLTRHLPSHRKLRVGWMELCVALSILVTLVEGLSLFFLQHSQPLPFEVLQGVSQANPRPGD